MLLNSGSCSYNGVQFTSLYNSRVSSKPILDEARRTTVYVEHTLTVHGYIAAQTTDDTMDALRQSLTACGGALDYSDKGFGDLTVNGASNVRDVAWGPIPEILEWIPIGNDNAAQITWRVTTRIPECEAARYEGALLAFNYEIAFDIDMDGYTTITTTGYFEIPMTRTTQGNPLPPDTVDNYRNRIAGLPLLGFQRSQNYRVSKDKRRCDFTIVDRQIVGAYPDGVTNIEATQSISSNFTNGGGCFSIWAITLDVNITLAAGIPKSQAWSVFLAIANSRLQGIRRGKCAFPTRFSLNDSIFGRSTHIVAEYRAMQLYGAIGAITATGVWQSVDSASYPSWRDSLSTSANNPRGQAQIGLQANDDLIVDLCINGDAILQTGTPVGVTNRNTLNAGGFAIIGLSPSTSWLYSRPSVRYMEASQVAFLKPLPLVALPPDAPAPSGAGVASILGNTATGAFAAASQTSDPIDQFQRPNSPTRVVVLEGTAARLGYRVTIPSLVSYQGLNVVEASREIQEVSMGAIPVGASVGAAIGVAGVAAIGGSVPVWATFYRIVYRMIGAQPVPTLPSPVANVNGLPGPSTGVTG